MKQVIWLLSALLMSSCNSYTPDYYVLSNAAQPESTYPSKGKVIGVKKVRIPVYLGGNKISIAIANHQIKRLDGVRWAEDLDTGLTHRLIAFLQKKFNQPAVYRYPWETNVSPDIKLSLNITRFIALGNQVYLDANWTIDSLKNDKRTTRLFSTKVPTNTQADVVVKSMDQAFSQLQENIAIGIAQY